VHANPRAADTFLFMDSTDWTAIAALSTLGTFIIAAIAAWIALKQVKLARELAEEQARPYVVAFLEERPPLSRLYTLVIRNIGQTAARNLRVTIDPPFVRAREDVAGHHFMDAVFLNEVTDVLAPQGEIFNFLDDGPERYETNLPGAFTVTLRYEDRAGAQLVDEYKLDFTAGRGDLRVDNFTVHHVAKALQAIAKRIGAKNFR
jgi:hypothetical protein